MWLLKHQQQLKQTLWLIMVCVLPILSNSKMIEKWSQIACLYCCCYCRVRRRRFLSKSFQWKRKFLWLLWWYYWVEWTWTSICGGMCVLKDLNLFYPSLCLTSIGKICNIFLSLSKVNFYITLLQNFTGRYIYILQFIHLLLQLSFNKIICFKNNHFSIWRNFNVEIAIQIHPLPFFKKCLCIYFFFVL